MKVMWFKMAYDVVTIIIFFESAQAFFFIYSVVLTSIIDYQNEWKSGSN